MRQSVPYSNMQKMRSSFYSLNGEVRIYKPIGSPAFAMSCRMLILGRATTLALIMLDLRCD